MTKCPISATRPRSPSVPRLAFAALLLLLPAALGVQCT